MVIKPKDFKQSQISINLIEHLMITILIFIASFIGIFFIGLKRKLDLLEYLMDHSKLYISICLILVLIANIYYVLTNINKKNIRYFNFDNNNKILTIGLCKNYKNKIVENQIKYENICYRMRKSIGISSLSDKTMVEIFDKDLFIGNLEPKGFIWSNSQLLIKRLFEELHIVNALKLETKYSKINIPEIAAKQLFGYNENTKSNEKQNLKKK